MLDLEIHGDNIDDRNAIWEMEAEAEANIVSSYADQEALEDGVVFDLEKITGKTIMLNNKPVNRATDTVYHEISEEVTPEKLPNTLHKIVNALSIIANDKHGDGYLLSVDAPNPYWFVANEVGGYTLMRPSDY